jgi:uncharacterized protein YndB with AHSA1/START domain
VNAPPERAFAVFTEQFGAWWPSSHSLVEGGWGTAVIEPREGGRWFERGATGAECDWGRVLAYEPPHRVVLSWHLDADYRYDPDPAHASEVEVRFAPEGTGTRVDLEHRYFERHADGRGATVADSVGGEGGWGALLGMYAQAAGSEG